MKNHKPLSSKNLPKSDENHQLIEDWIGNAKPALSPVVAELDKLIRMQLDDPRYAIKWGKAYYCSPDRGWCIELVAYDVSANIIFPNGSNLKTPPEFGDDSRYVKIKGLEELESSQIQEWIKQLCHTSGWAWKMSPKKAIESDAFSATPFGVCSEYAAHGGL